MPHRNLLLTEKHVPLFNYFNGKIALKLQNTGNNGLQFYLFYLYLEIPIQFFQFRIKNYSSDREANNFMSYSSVSLHSVFFLTPLPFFHFYFHFKNPNPFLCFLSSFPYIHIQIPFIKSYPPSLLKAYSIFLTLFFQ